MVGAHLFGPYPEEHREAMRLEGWTAIECVAILRDARKSALLRMRAAKAARS
jgi:hypothetical protein